MVTTIGLLSDSHGRADTTEEAVQLLIEQGADLLIHLGDVGTEQVLDALAAIHPQTGQQIESHLVFGNTDWDHRALKRYAQSLGIVVHEPAGVIVCEGCRVGFTHGHQPAVMQGLVDQGVEYLLHGHTHVQADETRGATRVINPGALFRAQRFTVALLRPADGDLRVLDVSSVVR